MYFYPSNMPMPQQSSYTSRHKPNILRTQMSDGYARQRLVNQGAPDSLSVQILLTESLYREFLEWFKGNIQCGASWFVMPLLSVDNNTHTEYRYVRIQNGELTATLVTTNNNDGSIYRLTMNLDASNTVIDDGTWEDHYLPQGSTDDEFGYISEVESAPVANVSTVIEEDVDTGADIGIISTTESANTYDEV